MTRQEGIEQMKALTRRQALPQLITALLLLEAKPKLEDAELLTRAVIMDVICEKSPEADAALDAWAEDLESPLTAVEALLAAIPA